MMNNCLRHYLARPAKPREPHDHPSLAFQEPPVVRHVEQSILEVQRYVDSYTYSMVCNLTELPISH